MKKITSFLCWLPFGVGTTWLSKLGWEVIGMPLAVALSLAVATSVGLGVLAHRAGELGHWVHYSGLVLVIVLATAVDGVNLEDVVVKNHAAKAQVARVEAGTASAGLATLTSLVTGLEEAIREKRVALDAELARGGMGPNGRALTARIDAMETQLTEKKTELAKAEMSAGTVQVSAVRTEAGVHVLAHYPVWSLYLGCLVLELVAAAVAFGQGRVTHRRTALRGQGRTRKRKPSSEPLGTQNNRITPVVLNHESRTIRRALETLGR